MLWVHERPSTTEAAPRFFGRLSPTDARDWRYVFMLEANDAADAQRCYVTKAGLEDGAVSCASPPRLLERSRRVRLLQRSN